MQPGATDKKIKSAIRRNLSGTLCDRRLVTRNQRISNQCDRKRIRNDDIRCQSGPNVNPYPNALARRYFIFLRK